MKPAGFSGAIIVLLMFASVNHAGEPTEPPFSAGGALLTIDPDNSAGRNGLLQLPTGHDAVTQGGESLFSRDWIARPVTRPLPGPGAGVAGCGACHVEAMAPGASPARADSGRLAPPLFGWGLLAAIPASTLQRIADPSDRNADGISGRLPEVTNLSTGGTAVGRFGWKAAQPNLYQQIATALMDDLNISTPLYAHAGHPAVPPDLSSDQLTSLENFIAKLAVPARRQRNDPAVLRGERVSPMPGAAIATCRRR